MSLSTAAKIYLLLVLLYYTGKKDRDITFTLARALYMTSNRMKHM